MFFLRYIGAICYDVFITLSLLFALTAIIVLFNHGKAIAPDTRWFQLALSCLALFYYYISISSGGQTLGMKAWKFKLVSCQQNNISQQQLRMRILYFIPVMLFAPFYLKASYNLLNRWTNTHFLMV